MDTPNPYAPPKAAVLDLPSPIGLKQRSVLLMIVFTVVTLGLYYPIWFLRRRKALNGLNSSKKVALWPVLLFGASFAVEFILGMIAGGAPVEETVGAIPMAFLIVLRLTVGISMIWQYFVIKDILEDHLNSPDDGTIPSVFVERVQLSGLATFFLSIFYLQYTINRHLPALQRTA